MSGRVRLWLVAAGAIAALCVAVAAAVVRVAAGDEAAASRAPAPRSASEQGDGWIAYSTAPADGQQVRRGGDGFMRYLQGSDVYLVRAGSEPRLVAGRGDGRTWNVCPAFSPDGSLLAFGTASPNGRAVRVVGVSRGGKIVVVPRLRLAVEGRGPAPCPRWSADGSRLAYAVGRRVVVRGLDGSSSPPRAGDPAAADFRREGSVVVSPTGDRVARLDAEGLVVTRSDGSQPRPLPVDGLGLYAIAAWSPDERTLLVMYDVSGFHFTIVAVPVDGASEPVTVVAAVRVNHPRSWPRNGDVSWQPTAA